MNVSDLEIPQAPERRAPATLTRPALRPFRRRGLMLGPGLSSAMQALWANRLRSLLTMLGIIVGVAAVIVAVAITEGTSNSINARVAGLGTNTLIVSPGAATTGGVRSAAGSQQTLTQADADALAGLPHVLNVSPVLSVTAQLVAGGQNWNTRAQGVYPSYQAIQNWQLAEGAWFSSDDEASANAVAVLGQTVAENLFGSSGADPLGQAILINSQTFHVVGVLQPKGAQGASNQDDVVFTPLSAASQRLNHSGYVSQIQVQADSADDVAGVQQAVTTALENRHQIASGAADDFQVRSSTQFVQTAQQFAQTLAVLLVGIAAISLLVGGIGVMNIMLVSVTERTREIGLRKALGARRSDIRSQFLLESLVLTFAAGLVGILVAVAIAHAVPPMPLYAEQFKATNHEGDIFLRTPPFVLAASFAILTIVGILSGLLPALRAAALSPIDALRAE